MSYHNFNLRDYNNYCDNYIIYFMYNNIILSINAVHQKSTHGLFPQVLLLFTCYYNDIYKLKYIHSFHQFYILIYPYH